MVIGYPLWGTDDARWHDEYNAGEYAGASGAAGKLRAFRTRIFIVALMPVTTFSNRTNSYSFGTLMAYPVPHPKSVVREPLRGAN